MTLRKIAHWLTWTVVAVVALAVLVVAALLIFQPTLELAGLKRTIEAQLTAFVEAPVTVERVWLVPSLWPTLGIENIVVESSHDEETTDFALLTTAKLQLGLIALLRKEIRLKNLRAEGVNFHLYRDEGRAGNWPEWTTATYEIAELKGLELRDVTINVKDVASDRQLSFKIQRLEGEIARDEALRLEMESTVNDEALSLRVTGPSLDELKQSEVPWPLEAALELGDLELELKGQISQQPQGAELDLLIIARGNRIETLAPVAKLELPEIGAYNLRARVAALGNAVTISELEGRLGQTDFAGSVAFSDTGERPKLTGALTFDQLDLAPWLQAPDPESDEATRGTDRLSTDKGSFNLPPLTALDTDITLTIARVSGLEPEVRKLTSRIAIQDGRLSAPVELRLGDGRLVGHLQAKEAEKHTLSVDLEAGRLPLGQLLRQVTDLESIEGEVGHMHLEAASAGITPEQLLEELTFELEATKVEYSYGTESDAGEVSLHLDRLALAQTRNDPMRLHGAGELLDEAFSVTFVSGRLADLAGGGAWPIHLHAQGAGAEAKVEGKVKLGAEATELDLEFDITSEHIGDLSLWLGGSPGMDLPYDLRGRLKTDSEGTEVRLDELRVGRSAMTGQLEFRQVAGQPPLVADLAVSTLDVDEMAHLINPAVEIDTEEDDVEVDIPVLPSEISFDNADIELTVDRLYRQPVDVTDIRASLHFRDGALVRSPFSLTLGNTFLEGRLGFDLRGEIPEARLLLSGRGIDVGNLLEQEKIAAETYLTVDRLEVELVARGSTPLELFALSELFATFENGHWKIHPPEAETALEIRIQNGEVNADKGQPIEVTAHGSIGETPVELEFTMGLTTDADYSMVSIPVNWTARIADAVLGLEGVVDLPLRWEGLRLDVSLQGENLENLSPLTGFDLPSFGPYRLSSLFTTVGGKYSLSNLEASVGSSYFRGELSIETGGVRPRIAADLTGGRVQLEDFLRNPKAADTEEVPVPADEESSEHQAAASQDPSEPFLTPDELRRFDAELSLLVEEMVQGNEWAGEGQIAFRLEDGRFEIDPFRFTFPQGFVNLGLELEAGPEHLEGVIRGRVEQFDYEGLFKLLDPESDLVGELTIDLDLRSEARSADELLGHADGHFDFTQYPEGVSTETLDLWATHLFAAILPSLDPDAEPLMNCVVGHFTVEEGRMTADRLVMDTTRIRVQGKGDIDLGSGRIDLTLKPRPKKRGLLSLATPARVTGTLADPKLHLSTSGFVKTIFRLSIWTWNLFREITRKTLPSDGHDICVDPPPRTSGESG